MVLAVLVDVALAILVPQRRQPVRALEDHHPAHVVIDVDVRDLDVTALDDAEEVFLSNSQFGILPVARCAARSWDRFDVTRRAMKQMATLGIEECAA